MSIRLSPFPSKYIINEEFAGQDKYFTGDFSYNDLLLAYGNHVKDYHDITNVAQNFYSAFSETLSQEFNPFYDFIVGSGGVEEVKSNWVRWRVYGKPERRAISMGNSNVDDCIGVAGGLFKLRLDVDWFQPQDVLAPIRNKRCQVVVDSECRSVGGAYEYDVYLLTDDQSATFPLEYLKQGDYWIKMMSITSDLASETAGSLQFGMAYSYLEFEVPMTTGHWEFKVTEDAHEKWGNLEVTRCDEKGRPMPEGKKITNFMEMEGMAQIKREKELFLAYGSMATDLIDKNSRQRMTTGPGLFEYMEESNVIPYSPSANNINKMVNEIQAIWFDRIPPSKRKLLLYTGEAGLGLFHRWIEQEFGQTATMTTTDFILGSAKPFEQGRNGFSFGNYQFTEYKVPTFGSITVAHWPILDNTRINGVLYPGSHFPVSSYEFIAFDIGFGEPNVKLLRREEKEYTGYTPGKWSPFGKVGPDNPVFKQPTLHNFWGYQWDHRCSFGLVMLDPSRSLHYKPSISC